MGKKLATTVSFGALFIIVSVIVFATEFSESIVRFLLITFIMILFACMEITIKSRKDVEIQKNFFEDVLNSIPIPMFIADENKVIEYVNDASLKMFNQTRENLVGGQCDQMCTSICNTPYCSIEQLLNNGNHFAYVDINEKSYQITSAVLNSEGGENFRFIEVMQDITELMEMQNALEEKSADLETVSESLLGGIVVTRLDDDFLVIRCNQGFYDLTNKGYMDIVGYSILECIPKEEIAIVYDQIITQLSSGNTAKLEHKLLNAKGETTWVSTHGRKTTLGGQEVCIWMFTDISDVKAVQERLRISEELYRVATSNTEDVIIDFDIVNRKFIYSDNVVEKYGMPIIVENAPEGIVEIGIIEERSVRNFIQMVEGMYEGKEKVNCTLMVKIKAGYAWVKMSFTVAFDDNKKPIRAIGIIQDISNEYEERRKYEREAKYRGAVAKDAILGYECKLIKREIISGHEKLSMNFLGEINNNYDKVMAIIINEIVHPLDKERILELIGIENILKSYRNGDSKVKFDYRRLTDAGVYRWVECTIYVLEDGDIDDLYAVYYIRDIDVQKTHEMELLEKAERDLLTGIYNKITTENYAKEYIEENPDKNGVFLIVDIDNFKKINDSLGHSYGDAVLKEVSAKLSEIFPEPHIVGRIGGDEFAIFLKNIANKEDIGTHAQSICDMFRTLYTGETHDYKISGTVGVSISPDHGNDFDMLYRRADTALYYAKGNGKDTYNIFTNDMKELSAVTTTEKDSDIIATEENLLMA